MSITHAGEAVAPLPEPSIKEYFELLRRRKVVFTQVFVAVLVLGVVVAALGRPVYQTYAKLLVPEASATFSLVDSNNPIASMLAAAQPDSLSTQLQVLQSGPFLTDAKREARVAVRPRVVPPVVRVEALAESNVLQVMVEGGDPEEIARLANTIVRLHLQRTELSETEGMSGTIAFVKNEREKAAKELAKADGRLMAFRRDHRIVQLAADQEANAREYVALQAKYRETQSNVTSSQAQIAELRARLGREPIDLVEETVKENPRRAKLEERRDDLLVQRAELLQEFLPTSQRIRALDERIARATATVNAEPETVRVRRHSPNPIRTALKTQLAELETSLRGSIAARNAARAEYEAKRQVVDNLGPWEVAQARLVHERDAAQTAYTSFSDRLRDLEIRSRARIRTARIVELASVPVTPIRPRKAMNVFFAAVLALFIGIGAVFLVEHLDDRVNTPDDVERIGALPTMGHIPLMPQGHSALLSGLPARSHIAEAYRALRSSVGFAAADGPLRRLVITSPAASEGKSTTATNLAIAMANDGKRVVLIDADLRRPNLHRLLGLPQGPGLSEVLVGRCQIDEVLQATEVENLSVIPSGSIPPNPAELLGAHAFRSLLQELERRADLVVIDTPPCVPVTDPLIVAARADGVLLVVHAGATRKEGMRQSIELLGRARARILGAVINQVEPNGGGRYYYRYYYHRSGYYGDEPSEIRPHRNGHEPKLAGNGAKPVALVAGRDESEEGGTS